MHARLAQGYCIRLLIIGIGLAVETYVSLCGLYSDWDDGVEVCTFTAEVTVLHRIICALRHIFQCNVLNGLDQYYFEVGEEYEYIR